MIWRILSKYLKIFSILIIFILTVGADKPVVSVHKKTILGPGDFNFNEAWFEKDPAWLGWPLPEPRTANSQGNYAEVSLSASPTQAGNAQARISVIFDWDLGGYSWEDVNHRELELTVDFSYQLTAVYTPYGSSNAGVFIRGLPSNFDNYWYDYIGHQYGTSEPVTRNRVEKFKTTVMDLDYLGRTLYGHVVCQALLPDFGELTQGKTNSSSATLTINSITVQPIPKTYGLFIGINNPPIGELKKVHGVESAEFVMASWAQLKDGEFQLLPGYFGYNGYSALTIDTIKSKINENLDAKKPGDNFIFFFCGHGGFDFVKGKEFLRISESEILYKDDLASSLVSVWAKGLNIWVILDSCRSGGFWDNALEFYDHTCLIASSEIYSYADESFGYALFSLNLASWLRDQRKNNTLDVNGDTVIDFNEFKAGIQTETKVVEGYIGQPVSIMENGETVIFNLDMWAPVAQKSADFNGVFSGEPKMNKALPWMMLLLD